MGGCAASKLGGGEEEDVVALCRERKRLLKSAVDRRYALGEAHSRYIHSLYAMAGAITLFIARHSSPTPILITLPPSSPPSSTSETSDPSFLRQTPTEPITEAAVFRWSPPSPSSSSASSEVGEGEVGNMAAGVLGGAEEAVEMRNGEMGYGCFFSGMPPPPPSPMRSFGWDFFDPFDGVRAAEEASMLAGLNRSSEEDLRVVREEEGIPELEEEGQQEDKGGGHICEGGAAGKLEAGGGGGDGDVNTGEMVPRAAEDMVATGGGNMGEKGEKGLTVVDTPTRERELLDALRDVVDHFIRAYDSGKEVSRMLEANMVHFHPGLEERKDNSSKFIEAITWHRSPSSQSSSSYKSFLASSSKDSSCTDSSKSDIFDDYGGMASGSHSQTLGRLYAWEKKLYEEVKAGDQIRRIYERKCSQLRNQDAKGVDTRSLDKTRSAAKDLYTRIWVAVRSAETISQRIQKLRDEELQPQLMELLKGLMDTWRIMLESHETQNQIMFEVKSFVSPAYGKFCTNAHLHVTFQLLAELQNWRACFISYLTEQKAYVEAIDGWLSKFILPEVEFCSRGRASVPPYRVGGPPVLVICHDWLTSLQKLPDRPVPCAMKSFNRELRVLCRKQDEEQQQKRKVDNLAKELDKKILTFQQAENRILEPKLSELKAERDMRHRVEYLSGRKELLDSSRRRLEDEKVKHHECVQETQRVTLNGFKTGLANIFDALTEFSRDSLKLYSTLIMYNDKTKQVDEDVREKTPTLTEVSEPEADCG